MRVDGQVADRLDLECRAGACIEVDSSPASLLPSLDEAPCSGWLAWVDDPPADRGSLELGDAVTLEFAVLERRDGLAAVVVHGAECSADTVCWVS